MADSNSTEKTIADERKTMLSALWIFLSVNYIMCDVLSNMESGVLESLITGNMAGIQVTQGFLLAAAISLEIPFAMIILSQALKYRANRWANIVAGLVMAVYQMGSFSVGTAPTLHYIFFSAIEVACSLFIAWYAWKWVCPADFKLADMP